MGDLRFVLTERQLRTHLAAAINAYVELEGQAPGATLWTESEVNEAVRAAVADEIETIKHLLVLERPRDRKRVLE